MRSRLRTGLAVASASCRRHPPPPRTRNQKQLTHFGHGRVGGHPSKIVIRIPLATNISCKLAWVAAFAAMTNIVVLASTIKTKHRSFATQSLVKPSTSSTASGVLMVLAPCLPKISNCPPAIEFALGIAVRMFVARTGSSRYRQHTKSFFAQSTR